MSRGEKQTFTPDRIRSYFVMEWLPLLLVTISGVIYNVGLLRRPGSRGGWPSAWRTFWEGVQRLPGWPCW